jgi:mannan endo-1,4-beta-mannosidase
MKKIIIFIAICMLLIPFGLIAQVWSDNFDDNSLSSKWVLETAHAATYTLTETGQALKIDYHRDGSAAQQWNQFHLDFKSAPLVLIGSKKISIKIRSDKALEIDVKPDYDTAGSDWLKTTIAGDNQWAVYTFDMSAKGNLEYIWIYLEGGSLISNTATVYFDDFVICPSSKGDLLKAIDVAELLNTNSPVGTGEGQFPEAAKTIYTNAISSAQAVYDNPSSTDVNYNSAIAALQTAMAVFESSVNATTNLAIVDAKATKATKYLLENLSFLSKSYVLFGMHDATSYGINAGGSSWYDDGTGSKSDPKVLVGSHPAIFSLDFSEVVEGGNIVKIQTLCKQAYNEGGIITMVWHQSRIDGSGDSWKITPTIVNTMLPGGINNAKYNAKLDQVANFANTLRNAKGESIPFIFRPYHEHNGSWFWWGKGNCTTQEYIALWKYTVDYLKNTKNVHNMLYAFSPDGQQFSSKPDYLAIYPGDSYVDVFGLDFYFGTGDQNEINKLSTHLTSIVQYATEKNKLAALTESGDRLYWEANGAPDDLRIPNWYTRCILGAIKTNETTKKIAYFATWRNASPAHHFVPYPGHPAVPDFQAFYDDPITMFLNDLPDMYSGQLHTGLDKPINANQNSRVKVYQNQASQLLNLESENLMKSIAVYGVTGQKMLNFNSVNSQSAEFKIGNLKPGVYIVLIELGDNTRVSRKIVIR